MLCIFESFSSIVWEHNWNCSSYIVRQSGPMLKSILWSPRGVSLHCKLLWFLFSSWPVRNKLFFQWVQYSYVFSLYSNTVLSSQFFSFYWMLTKLFRTKARVCHMQRIDLQNDKNWFYFPAFTAPISQPLDMLQLQTCLSLQTLQSDQCSSKWTQISLDREYSSSLP